MTKRKPKSAKPTAATPRRDPALAAFDVLQQVIAQTEGDIEKAEKAIPRKRKAAKAKRRQAS